MYTVMEYPVTEIWDNTLKSTSQAIHHVCYIYKECADTHKEREPWIIKESAHLLNHPKTFELYYTVLVLHKQVMWCRELCVWYHPITTSLQQQNTSLYEYHLLYSIFTQSIAQNNFPAITSIKIQDPPRTQLLYTCTSNICLLIIWLRRD